MEAIARAAGKGVVRTAKGRFVASAVESVVNSEEAKEGLLPASSSIIESKNVEFIRPTINFFLNKMQDVQECKQHNYRPGKKLLHPLNI